MLTADTLLCPGPALLTHIGAWARRLGVHLDPLYASEEREGGTQALGTSIPALSRQTLSVFSAENWQQEKSRMVHESWLEHAKARITETNRNSTSRTR